MKHKILLASPVYDRKKYIIEDFLDSVRKIAESYFKFSGDKIDILFADNSATPEYSDFLRNEGFNIIQTQRYPTTHETLACSYNAIRDYFLHKDYTHLMIIEQDVLCPEDIIQKLLAHKKDVCSGLFYLGKNENKKPCVMMGHYATKEEINKLALPIVPKKLWRYDFIDEKELKKELIKVYACGLGCILIKRKVIEKIPFRVRKNLNNEWRGHNDMMFHEDCRTEKIGVYLDPTILCRHENDTYK